MAPTTAIDPSLDHDEKTEPGGFPIPRREYAPPSIGPATPLLTREELDALDATPVLATHLTIPIETLSWSAIAFCLSCSTTR